MPLSIVGSNGGSFRKLNVQISQTIESLQLICKSLNQSERNWWSSRNMLLSTKEMKSLKMKDRQEVSSEAISSNDQGNFPYENQVRDDNSEDDEMIDLQANEDEQSSLYIDDDKYGQGLDGNISGDESL